VRDRAIILYDGLCPLCTASVRRLRRLDWRGCLAFADAREAAVQEAHPDIDPVRALARMHLVPPDGAGVLDGFHAVRWIAGRVPLLWPLWPLLWLPGAARVGVPLYDLVARNRFVFARCTGECHPGHGDR
jgi:predicted DCC family thiol-disulfide oxidoreductase YuxK